MGKCFQFNFLLIWKPTSQILERENLCCPPRVISNWFNMDLSIMQLIPFLPAVTIPKAGQINDFSVSIFILIIDIHCPRFLDFKNHRYIYRCRAYQWYSFHVMYR